MKILPVDNSYRAFCDLVSGYRLFRVMSEAVNCGVIDLLEDGAMSSGELLTALAMEPAAGRRFIDLLVNVGLLEGDDSRLQLSRFSSTFLNRTSTSSQRQVLAFEPLLMENWNRLGTVLYKGQGALLGEQTPKECQQRLDRFQQAMGETAAVRSPELWDALPPLPDKGIIIDIGAGAGVYLREFLCRHPGWQGVACDLADVCARMAGASLPANLTPYPCNILDAGELAILANRYRGRADLLLFSNICHCYAPEENRAMLLRTLPLLAPKGLLVIHDFFRDANSYGALYDLHMLVNTYNGRSYTIAETTALLADAGLPHHTVLELPSASLAIVASHTTPLTDI
jgi:hypothetical protein